jgi:hypothetical protein
MSAREILEAARAASATIADAGGLERVAAEVIGGGRTASEAVTTVAEKLRGTIFGRDPNVLSDAKFTRVLGEGRAFYLMNAVEPLRVSGEFKIKEPDFARLAQSYSNFTDELRNGSSLFRRKSVFTEAHRIFEDQLVPAAETAGIPVSRVRSTYGSIVVDFDIPLHPEFLTKSGGKVDLNTRSGLNAFLRDNTDKQEWRKYVQGEIQKRASKLGLRSVEEQGDLVPFWERQEWFAAAKKFPELKNIRHPDFAQPTQDGDLVVPLKLNMAVPNKIISFKKGLINSAYIKFEEATHVMQILNERGLTSMGSKLERALSDGVLVRNKDVYSSNKSYVMENELLAVWRELGLRPPEKHFRGYDRWRASVDKFAPRPTWRESVARAFEPQ